MLEFTQDFKKDLEQVYLKGEPYALIRFGDGERAFCEHRPIKAGTAGWRYDGSDTRTSRKVLQAVTADVPGLYIGVSCPCCDVASHEWYLSKVTAPSERLTFANIFVNSNYARAKQLIDSMDRADYTLVACNNADITVPANAIKPEFDYAPTLKAMQASKKIILVAAGPMKCGLIYDYWTTTPPADRQIVLDVGSVMDRYIHGRPTRQYHKPGTPTSKRVCVWSK